MKGTTTNGLTNGNTNGHSPIRPRLYSVNAPPSLDDFKKLTTQSRPTHYPLAASIEANVPIYDLPDFSELSSDQRSALQDEWYHILLSGPGVFVTRHLYKDRNLLNTVNDVYSRIIEEEKKHSGTRGDHFAGSGANDRIWNSFSKHCLQDAKSFVEYYSNPWLSLISSAWLGPHHHLTAQVNIVKPGAKPQISHRDYHIGFQDNASCAQFPKALQVASQFLTLQGAVAHSDMPLESGPTRLLPFSQMFEEGYMAYRIPEFQDFFIENYVSMPLEQGDGLFFNPALFHAAGQNDSEGIMRSANLLQISSAFGKPMEMIDTYPLVDATWDLLTNMHKEEGFSDKVRAFVGNVAEGYPFPTNLDRRVPETAGMAPENEQGLLIRGLREGWSKERVLKEMQKMRDDSRA
ncbi:phytanoyl-CoA dioxygenase-like protein [Karstenula rhodostoma CBS 690.94]|uniref:Phytanoyl-CoA dioxygenase-like protein n=1 Tax=Karstenula rhodostoma CBS 690.94 TaxID=1392251 RepID=A0A9P4PNM8_9PLEO|nr:phytanoyl-CoA dioxygenase-like protein [Karstenula rhodostoma CBS 690.94]